jgi:small subunit ribosomal protein S5
MQDRERSEFAEEIVQISRVSKKTKGGNKIGFSVLVVVGDKNGKVGVGLGKAPDVASSIRKGLSFAKKHLVEIPIVKGTIPFQVRIKLGAAKILLKPAPVGSGIIAGGAVRSVVAAAGFQNISSKVLGTNNKASNVYATMEALRVLSERYKKMNALRGKKDAVK